MHTDSFGFQRQEIFSGFDHSPFPQGNSPSGIQDVRRVAGRAESLTEGFLNPALPNYTVNDYRVGQTDTLHATMVYEFLRLFCQEEPSSQGADAVLIVDLPGCIHGYGCRYDSSFVGMVARWSGCLITEMLAEHMKGPWLNQNIDSIALQRRQWRLFRVYDSGTSHMVLMEFHPVEMQRTALVLWALEA